MKTAIAVALAVFATFCFALGSLIQQSSARQTHGRSLRFGLLVTLVREERWLGGMALTGGLCVVAGMATFVAVSPPTSGVGAPGITAWIAALTGIAALTALSAFAALRTRGPARVILLAGMAAMTYGVLDAVTKSTVDILPDRGVGVLTTWEPYALLVTGVLGNLFGQSAFNAGPLSLSLPVVDTVEPATAVVLAAVVFHESLARTPWHLALQLLGAAIAVTGIVLLSYSCVVQAEDRRETALAAREGKPAS